MIQNRLTLPASLAALLLLAACAIQPDPVRACNNENFLIDAQFDAGNFHRCDITGPHRVTLDILPEDERINPSPWYAFRVASIDGNSLQINLQFKDFPARYWPKISLDGEQWRALDEGVVQKAADGNSMTITLDDPAPLTYIAAQELVAGDYYREWFKQLAGHDELALEVLGHSVEGRPVRALTSTPHPETVVLLGRQHPPEITGALGMRPFVDTLLADTNLARRFRARYMLLIAPLINPDGVAHGHWRHNVNGADLNRDWGPFTQPETQGLAERLGQLEASGSMPALMLDFHSTRASLFYTQLPEDFPPGTDFATKWLSSARQRLPGYEFRHEARATSEQANTKNYFFSRYDIPAITYELGDEADRDDIAASSVVFAEEMMRLMLGRP